MTYAQREKRLLEIYESLPKMECKGLCHQACGPILFSEFEAERMHRNGVTPPNAMEMLNAAAKASHDNKPPANLSCPLLCPATKTCTKYDLRPMICRLYGAVRQMPCPHGCKPDRILSDRESNALLKEVDRL